MATIMDGVKIGFGAFIVLPIIICVVLFLLLIILGGLNTH